MVSGRQIIYLRHLTRASVRISVSQVDFSGGAIFKPKVTTHSSRDHITTCRIERRVLGRKERRGDNRASLLPGLAPNLLLSFQERRATLGCYPSDRHFKSARWSFTRSALSKASGRKFLIYEVDTSQAAVGRSLKRQLPLRTAQ